MKKSVVNPVSTTYVQGHARLKYTKSHAKIRICIVSRGAEVLLLDLRLVGE